MKNLIKYYLLVCFLQTLCQEINAQNCTLIINHENSQKVLLKKTTTPFQAKQAATNFINNQIKDGFLSSSYDTIVYEDEEIILDFHQGQQYSWKKLEISIDDLNRISAPAYKEKLIANRTLNAIETKSIIDEIIDHYENNGYPFARIKLEDIKFDRNEAEGKLSVNTGPLIKIDTIYIKGNAQINQKWIRTYLDIDEKDYYNEKVIQDISRKIQFINFIKEIKSSEVVFSPRGADLYLYLDKVQSSSINGVIGFLPDDNDKINITGDVKLKLENAFKIGEKLELNWRKLQPQTQDLKINIDFPLLFGTSFGVAGKFNLYKRDTTFLEIKTRAGFNYRINSLLKLNLMYELHNSSLLSGVNQLSDPSLGNARKNAYIFGFESQKLDRFINPSKGYEVISNFSFIRRNAEQTIEDSVTNVTTTNYAIDLNFKSYIPFFNRNVIMLGFQGQHIIAPELFRNELIRFGGLNTFRGFDEESLNASTLGIATLEYRFLLDRYSNVFAFFDGAFYEAKTTNEYIRDLPFGFGAGIQFTTNAGTFVLVYALGKQFNNPILIRTGKIHFGYVNYF